MTTPLHAALGRYGSELSYDMIEEACRQNVTENALLDWKSELPLPARGGRSDQDSRARSLELAKDIAAMANGRGGLLVYGVVEGDADRETAIESVGDLSDGVQIERIQRVAYSHIYPPVRVKAHPLTNPNGSERVLVIEVPESDDAPHLVQPKRDGGNDGWLIAPYREGPHTLNMVEKQIESAYRQRIGVRHERTRSLRELHDELIYRHIPEEDAIVGTVVAIAHPVSPRRSAWPDGHPSHTAKWMATEAGALATQVLAASEQPGQFVAAVLGKADSVRRAVRRHVVTASEQKADRGANPLGRPAEVALELHDDGSIGLAWRRGGAYNYPHFNPEIPLLPGLAESDMDGLSALLCALVVVVSETLALSSDYQLRISIEPRVALQVTPDDSGHGRIKRWVPPTAALETELRLTGDPQTRADDMLALGQDLNSMVERSQSALDHLTPMRSSRSARARDNRDVLRRLFGGDTTITAGDSDKA